MVKLKKIGVISLAKLQAVLAGCIGLITGIIYAGMGVRLGALTGSMGLGAGLGFLSIVAFPIAYAIIGFIGGAIGALLYNLIAERIGGVEMEFEQ